jgi:imidazole glycerol-phosphate synthase subunit HisH
MIGIVDYGVGNLGSILNMHRKLGIAAEALGDPAALATADRLILPGIGAFDACVTRLRAAGFEQPLLEAVGRGVPLLGICVGMQMLTAGSEEGSHPGLNLIPARTARLQPGSAGLKVPHMGWNDVRWTAPDPLVEGLEEGARFYFVHSYYVVCDDPAHQLGTAQYGHDFAAAIHRGRIYGVQFHPEKSHRFGLRLLGNFARA